MTKKKKKARPKTGPKPTGIGHKFTLQLYVEDEAPLDELAAAQGRSRGWVIREMVRSALVSNRSAANA